jgi:hypothetical protein
MFGKGQAPVAYRFFTTMTTAHPTAISDHKAQKKEGAVQPYVLWTLQTPMLSSPQVDNTA